MMKQNRATLILNKMKLLLIAQCYREADDET